MAINSFELPPVTERNLMPFVAELMTGTEEVKHPSLAQLGIRAERRTTATFTGELAVWDGPLVRLGMHADDEEFDVVILSVFSIDGDEWRYGGSTGIGVLRRGSSPIGGVDGGSLMIDTGTLTVSTVEQLAEEAPHLNLEDPVVPGEISDSVRLHNGHGDGATGIVALVDQEGRMCGVVLGDLFEESGWGQRILQDEKLTSMQELHSGLTEYGAEEEYGRIMPVRVYREREFLGYVDAWDDLGDGMTLNVSDASRPPSREST